MQNTSQPPLQVTLLCDGASDRALLGVIEWFLRKYSISCVDPRYADLGQIPRLPKRPTLAQRVKAALDYYPCDLLCVHRDAETSPHQERYQEITDAISSITCDAQAVPIVPVRMTEAWLLHDEAAIRQVSGYTHGKTPLQLPSPSRVEQLADPKDTLSKALETAAEITNSRKLKDFKSTLPTKRIKVAEYITDYSPLRGASPSFDAFYEDMSRALRDLGRL